MKKVLVFLAAFACWSVVNVNVAWADDETAVVEEEEAPIVYTEEESEEE